MVRCVWVSSTIMRQLLPHRLDANYLHVEILETELTAEIVRRQEVLVEAIGGRPTVRRPPASSAYYCEICWTTSPVRASCPSWAMSACARMPASLPSSSTT